MAQPTGAKAPQDRKPKQQGKKSAQSTQKAATPAPAVDSGLTEVDREVVDVGLDDRPIPMRIFRGDRIWEFDPDPSMQQWERIEAAIGALRAVRDDEENAVSAASEGLRKLTAAIADLLVADAEEFVTRNYGPFALERLASKLMETITGFPTK